LEQKTVKSSYRSENSVLSHFVCVCGLLVVGFFDGEGVLVGGGGGGGAYTPLTLPWWVVLSDHTTYAHASYDLLTCADM